MRWVAPTEKGEIMAAKLLDPIPPGEVLYEEFMKPLGVSINALAREIAVPPNRISEIVSGKRSITADTALRLGKYFGVSAEIWLGLQADYDLRVVKRTTWLKAEPRVRVHAD
jgi:addiction module HigA family antidote